MSEPFRLALLQHQVTVVSRKLYQEQIIQAYLASGLNITDYCKKTNGAIPVSLLSWLEQAGYRMTLSDSDSELKSKIKQLNDELLDMTLKYERAELLEARGSQRAELLEARKLMRNSV